MKTRKDGSVRRQLNTLFNVGAIRELTDGQLLERFATDQGEVAELAFEALVERHGAMVLRVCRAQLADPQDTQDAFQATFLILVKKARGLWVRDSLGPWLHQVAFRTAVCARANSARRRRHERLAAEGAAGFVMLDDGTGSRSELERVLHEEINRLPDCYRIPIVLCDLEDRTCEEAARRMGCPVGTVKSWRFRGRQRLRERLIRLGLAPSVALGATMAAPAGATTEEVVRNAMGALSQWMTAGEVSASVRVLVKGVLRTMIMGKLRMTAAAFFAVVFLSAGLGAVAWGVGDNSKKADDQARLEGPRRVLAEKLSLPPGAVNDWKEPWSMTLREAINIGLEHSEIVRVVSRGESASKIAQYNADADPERFKSELMAHLRSIEQCYWRLAQANVELWAADRAVSLGEEILKREQADNAAGKANVPSMAEVAQRLEQFKLDLVTKTSDVNTTERQLRNILGLPPSDNRRIIPVTAPTETQVSPNWDASRMTMLEKQPDIIRQTALLKRTESDRPGKNQAQVDRQKAFLEQVIHQTTHSLARFFLEIDANYKQFKTASRLRAAAALRLESQRAYYEEGRITIDRFLDAVSQYATAVATEAQYKASYNVSIVALEEAKGTLLDYEKIELAFGPSELHQKDKTEDGGVKRASVEPQVVAQLAQGQATALPSLPSSAPVVKAAQDASADTETSGKTVSFQFTIGTGSRPIEVRGSFTVKPAPAIEAVKGR